MQPFAAVCRLYIPLSSTGKPACQRHPPYSAAALAPVLFFIAIHGSFVTGLCPGGVRAVSDRSPGGRRLIHSPQVHLRPD